MCNRRYWCARVVISITDNITGSGDISSDQKSEVIAIILVFVISQVQLPKKRLYLSLS